MASLRAALFSLACRLTVKRRLASCKTALDVRKVFAGPAIPAPRGVPFTADSVGGIAGEWAGRSSSLNLLYLHGGGYVGCSARTYRAITGGFARRGFGVFAPDYRLAPEFPFPAALEDAVATWRGLRARVEGTIAVAGDSAGGGLALALLMRLRDLGEKGPSAACLFSPWTDLASTGATVQSNADRDPLLVANCLGIAARPYLGNTDARAPLASPLFGEFAGLPPLIFFVGESEILLDDSRRAAEKARAAQIVADLRVWQGVPHVWQLADRFIPEARRSMDEAAAFLKAPQPGLA